MKGKVTGERCERKKKRDAVKRIGCAETRKIKDRGKEEKEERDGIRRIRWESKMEWEKMDRKRVRKEKKQEN